MSGNLLDTFPAPKGRAGWRRDPDGRPGDRRQGATAAQLLAARQ
jgi:hypothetical protein